MSKSNAKAANAAQIENIQTPLAEMQDMEQRHYAAPTVAEALPALNAFIQEAMKAGITKVAISRACGYRFAQTITNALDGKTSVSMEKILTIYRATRNLLEEREQKRIEQ